MTGDREHQARSPRPVADGFKGGTAFLAVLLLLYLVLGWSYAVNTPIFESPDESSHLQVIRYIAHERRLPPYQIPERRADTAPNMAWLVGYQNLPLYYAPPLYHVLAALLTAWAPMDDLPDRLVPSPSWGQGFSPDRGSDPWNKNVFVHLPGETLRESSTVRAAAVLRGLSIVLGAVTVLCTYAIAREIWPEQAWVSLGAAGWVALNPQFVASHAGVSNDPLTIALFSITLLILLRLLRSEARWPGWVGLGTIVGLGMLTKQSALMLLPVGALGAFVSAWGAEPVSVDRARALKGVRRAVALGVTAVLVGGGWYLANLIHNGDVLGTEPHYAVQVSLERFGWQALLGTLQSYWVAYGWALITAPWWLYAAAGLVAGLGLAGIARALLSPRGAFRTAPRFGRRALVLLAVAFALNFVALTRWARETGAPYGRLLFPTISAAGVLLAWGLAQWRSICIRRSLAVIAGLACVAAVLLPWLLLRPAFLSPFLVEGMPDSATRVAGASAGGVGLIGFELDTDGFRPGDSVVATLYWQAMKPPDGRLTISAQFRGLDPMARFADDTRWLGGTLYPTTRWRTGDVVAHTVRLSIPDWTPVPTLAWLDVRMLDQDDLLVSFDQGLGDAVTLGPWRVRPRMGVRLQTGVRQSTVVPEAATHMDVGLGPAIRLDAYEVRRERDVLVVDLYWRAEAVPDADYTVFVHWGDGGGAPVAQHDGPPADGAYPTSWWLAGDVIPDRHVLPLPDAVGEGALTVGMYAVPSGVRLPATEGSGVRLPDDAVPLLVPD